MKSDGMFRDLALLTARLVVGASIAAHGAQKMYGAFGGPGLEGAAKMFGSLGFSPAKTYAVAASAGELTSGVFIATGTLGPVGPAMLLSIMAVAVETVHRKNGYFAAKSGFELNAMYAVLALLLATQGYGRISLDAATGLQKATSPALGCLAIAGGLAVAGATLSQRRIPPPGPQTIRVEKGSTEPAASEA